ncbi:MAG: hypothetical protein HC905_11275 [Bacteroidales bacterium]|nr:hypothetical protein [Bacteroidales bacterium]
MGDADYSPAATASSGLTVSYASSNTAVATIVSGKIHIVGPGTTIITASQAGNGNYSAASDVTQSLTVNKQNQTITFGAIPAKLVGGADFSPGATASSGLTVSYASSNPAVATIVANQIHIVGVGTSTITASQAGNATYAAASDVTQLLTVNKNSQTITFAAIPAKTYGTADFSPGATASSGLTVSYASSDPAVATIVANQIHIIGVGTSTITASQSGNSNYNAASDVVQTLTVNKANQTITFGALTAMTYGDADLAPGATSSSGLSVAYASSNPAVATIVAGKIHIISSGSSIITASQAGDANYNAATNVTQTLTVNKASQTITFGALPGKTYGDVDMDPAASSSSGLTVSYSSGNTAVATIVAGKIHITGAGSAVITASQSGDGNYSAASNVTQTLTVVKANQSITFGPLTSKLPTDPDFNPGASSNSGLAVAYSSSNPGVATIVAGNVHIVGVGTTTITASQTGNSNYNAATSVDQTFTVGKLDQTITFASIPSKVYGSADFDPGASASSGLAVTYSSDNTGVVSIVAGKIHPVAAGTANITASQGGDITYNAAPDKIISFEVTAAPLTVTAVNKTKIYGEANPALTVSYSGFVGSDDESVLATLPDVATAAQQNSSAGDYDIVPSGASASNYSISYVNGTLTISKKLLTVTAANQSKIYGEPNPSLTILYSGFIGSEDATVLGTAPVASTIADQTSDVGSYAIVPGSGIDENYSFNYVNGSLTIEKKELNVKADNLAKSFGDPNPVLTISYTGFVNSDNESVINSIPAVSTTAVQLSPAGSYPIILSGGSDNNYTLNLVDGTLLVNLRTLTVNIKDLSKSYGDPNPAIEFTYSGFVDGDDESVLDQLPEVTTIATQFSNAGDYDITGSGGSDNFYTFFFTSGKLRILKKEITVTVDNATKVYGENNPAFTLHYSGFITGEDETDIDELPVASTPANALSGVGSYVITPAGGFGCINYSFSYSTALLEVTKKDIAVVAEDKARFYGDSNPVLTIQYIGMVNGDDGSGISGEPEISTSADALSPAGTYPITLSGGSDDNYNIVTLTNGLLTVKKKELLVVAENKEKLYGEPNPELTSVYTGFVNGEDQSVLSELPVLSVSASASSPVGNYPVTISGGSDENYAFVFTDGSLSIGKNNLTFRLILNIR